MKKTFTEGTAKPLMNEAHTLIEPAAVPSGLWGKTGTIIAGTNSHHSYGLFTGGCNNTGVIVILRKGKGTDAAHLALSLFKQESHVMQE